MDKQDKREMYCDLCELQGECGCEDEFLEDDYYESCPYKPD